MMDPAHTTHNVEASLGVLLASGVVDAYSLFVAHQFLKQSADKEKMGLWQYMQSGRWVGPRPAARAGGGWFEGAGGGGSEGDGILRPEGGRRLAPTAGDVLGKVTSQGGRGRDVYHVATVPRTQSEAARVPWDGFPGAGRGWI